MGGLVRTYIRSLCEWGVSVTYFSNRSPIDISLSPSALNMDTPLWDYSGDTIISNSEIRITPDRASKSGRIWNSIVSFYFHNVCYCGN